MTSPWSAFWTTSMHPLSLSLYMHPRCHFPNYEYRSNPRNPRLNNNRKPPVEYYATSWTNIEVKLFYYGNFNVVYPEAIRELTAHFHPTPPHWESCCGCWYWSGCSCTFSSRWSHRWRFVPLPSVGIICIQWLVSVGLNLRLFVWVNREIIKQPCFVLWYILVIN